MALNQIESCYNACENSILNYADGVKRQKRSSFDWFTLTSAEMLAINQQAGITFIR
jgi:hypothetical protein